MMTVETDTEKLALVEVSKRLAKIKKIPVAQSEASYLADMISNIEKGDVHAHWNLGECFLNGKVVLAAPFPKDKKNALFWFRRSAELGLASSQYHLGVIYLGDTAWLLGMQYSEENALEKNIEEAIKWLRLAASQSDTFAAIAQDVLGEMYFLGIGVSRDHAQAFALFSKSVANPANATLSFGLPTRATERLPMLKAEGYT